MEKSTVFVGNACWWDAHLRGETIAIWYAEANGGFYVMVELHLVAKFKPSRNRPMHS